MSLWHVLQILEDRRPEELPGSETNESDAVADELDDDYKYVEANSEVSTDVVVEDTDSNDGWNQTIIHW